jgi:hypothetical protein
MSEKRTDNAAKSNRLVGIALATAAGTAGVVYLLLRRPSDGPSDGEACTPGALQCVGYDLYRCNEQGELELVEENAFECGYDPGIWFGDDEELAKGIFTLIVIEGGWVDDNVELGRKDFNLEVTGGGWEEDNEALGSLWFDIRVS